MPPPHHTAALMPFLTSKLFRSVSTLYFILHLQCPAWAPAGFFPGLGKLGGPGRKSPVGSRDGAPVEAWGGPKSLQQTVKIMHK